MNLSRPVRSRLNAMFWVLALVLALNFFRTRLPRAHAQTLRAIPYTVVLDQRLIMPDGTTVPALTITWAIRSDGSRVNKIVGNTPPALVERIIDYANGREVYAFDLTRQRATRNDSSLVASRWLRVKEQNCQLLTSEAVAGTEIVGAYKAVKLSQPKHDSWYAPDFGCALVRDRMDWGDKGVNETDLVSLTMGEPSPDLFAEPTDYAQASQMDIFNARKAQLKAYLAEHPQAATATPAQPQH